MPNPVMHCLDHSPIRGLRIPLSGTPKHFDTDRLLPANRMCSTSLKSYTRIDPIMAPNIRNPESERLAAELARRTGKTKIQAVTDALREPLARLRAGRRTRRDRPSLCRPAGIG